MDFSVNKELLIEYIQCTGNGLKGRGRLLLREVTQGLFH